MGAMNIQIHFPDLQDSIGNFDFVNSTKKCAIWRNPQCKINVLNAEIPFSEAKTLRSIDPIGAMDSNWQYTNPVLSTRPFFSGEQSYFKTKTIPSRPRLKTLVQDKTKTFSSRPRLFFRSSRRLETKTMSSRTTAL